MNYFANLQGKILSLLQNSLWAITSHFWDGWMSSLGWQHGPDGSPRDRMLLTMLQKGDRNANESFNGVLVTPKRSKCGLETDQRADHNTSARKLSSPIQYIKSQKTGRIGISTLFG